MTSTGNVLLMKTAIVVVVFCLAECAAGANKHPKSSCLKYGHSCWGGHGKRNMGSAGTGGGGGGLIRVRGGNDIANTRWYLSRLVQAPADFQLWKDERDKHIMVARNPQDRRIQNDSESDVDISKRHEDGDDLNAVDSVIPDETDSEEVVLMEEPPSTLGQKLRLYKLMQRNVEKMN